MENRVLLNADPFDSPAGESLPPRFELLGRYLHGPRPGFRQIIHHIAPPNVTLPEITKVVPGESVKPPSCGKTQKIINAFLPCGFLQAVSEFCGRRPIFVVSALVHFTGSLLSWPLFR